MKTSILFFLLISLQLIQIELSAADDQFNPLKVGVTDRDYSDSNRSNWLGTGPRPVRSVIWYPAGNGGRSEIIIDSSQFPAPVKAIRDSKISNLKRRYPLILISHGSQGNAAQMRWLGYYLASRGYITVAINHNGTDTEERKTGPLGLTDFCMWERPADISVVLDKILEDPLFSGKIDTARIAVAGFSLGGASAIWVAGAIFNIAELGRNEPPPPPFIKVSVDQFIELGKTDTIIKKSYKHSGDTLRDKRIKAVFALAPAIGQGFTKEGLQGITIPVQIVVGDADVIAPRDHNAEYYTKNIPAARPLIVLPGERGHYLTPSRGTERSVELREVSQLAFVFFEDVLR